MCLGQDSATLQDWGLPKRLSLDEFARKKGKGQFATILTDLDKSSLLEVVDSHKSDDIIAVLKQQPESIRAQVEEVCVDMWGCFPKVIREVFTNAKVVIDLSGGIGRIKKWLISAQIIFVNAAATLKSHLEEICNYFKNRTTSGVTEGINTKIKLIIRHSYGFKNFEFSPFCINTTIINF